MSENKEPEIQLYGKVVCPNGNTIGGMSLEEVLELSADMHSGEQSLYDIVGDIAVEAQLVGDLAGHIVQLKEQMRIDHEQAGITINYELRALQVVALAHGVMATLISAKDAFGEEHQGFKSFEEQCHARIAQCLVTLVEMGIPADVANQRILQGH